MTIFINESGMAFGPYEVRHCLYMEKSRLYLGLGPGVQIAEFALLRNGKHGQAVWLIEAKSSSPRPGTLRDFDRFIAEITQKMSNSVQLLMAAILERHPDTGDLSADFKAIALKSIGFKCVLVINGHKDAWLAPLQDALVKAMRPLCKSLGLDAQAVAVMNETTASQTGLITV